MALICQYCGGQVRENKNFCPSCGHATSPLPPQAAQNAPLTQHSQPQQTSTATNPAPPTQYSPQPQYSQTQTHTPPPQQQSNMQPPQYQQQQHASPATPPAQQPQYAQQTQKIPPQYTPQHQIQQQQNQQQESSAYAEPKSKNKIIIIIAAAGVLVALAVLLIVTNVFGLLGTQDGDNGDSNGTNASLSGDSTGSNSSGIANTIDGVAIIDIPANASAEELLAYNYIELAAEFYQLGVKHDTGGLVYCADNAYAIAAASTSAMRYAVDCLLEMKGVPPTGDDRMRDWDEIAALGWMSPFPYFFEGVVLEAKGDSSGAAECYRKAALNPNFLDDMVDFKTIKDMDQNALNGLKAELEKLEDMIFGATYGAKQLLIPRDENNFDVDYMREKGMECLEADEGDLIGAFNYYFAALLLNPFDGDSYAHLVIVSLYMDDSEMLLGYLTEGLLLDPENVKLNFLRDIAMEVN